MKLNILLSVAGVYMALIGLAFIVIPATMQYGTLGANPSAALLMVVRATASLFFGLAVLNWMARNSEPSVALRAIVMGDIVGFATAAILLALAALSGADQVAFVPAVINLILVILFIMAGRASMAKTS